MSEYTIELFWRCRNDKTLNRGLAAYCTECGKPKQPTDEEVWPDDIGESNAITDTGRLCLANAGPDWQCRYCDTLQNATGHFCIFCGADQRSGARPWKTVETTVTEDQNAGTRTVSAHDVTVAPPVPKAKRHSSSKRTLHRHKPRREHDDGDDGAGRTVRRHKPSRRKGVWLLAIVVVPLVAMLIWNLFRDRIVDAQVAALQWKRLTMVERKSTYPFEGWAAPSDAFDVHEVGQRIHHYDHVKVGSHRETYQERYSCGKTCVATPRVCVTLPRACRSNKNGTARCSGGGERCSGGGRTCSAKYCSRAAYRTVDDYEDQPRYRAFYAWKAWMWKHNRDIPLAGTDNEPRWPTEEELRPSGALQPGEEERTSNHEVLFKVTFAAGKETFAHEPETEAAFRGFGIGSRYRLTMSVAAGIKSVVRLE